MAKIIIFKGGEMVLVGIMWHNRNGWPCTFVGALLWIYFCFQML